MPNSGELCKWLMVFLRMSSVMGEETSDGSS